MGFLDRLAGGGGSKGAPKEEAAAAKDDSLPSSSSSQGQAPGGLQADLPTLPAHGPPSLDISALGAAAALPGMMAGIGSPAPGGSGRLYDPYEGISSAVVSKRHTFKLPDQPEFVFEDQAAVRRRGWSENLQFYTGAGYLSGGVVGVGAGAYSYATVKPDMPIDSLKLKANRILNLTGSRAKPFSCGAAILGLYFSIAESASMHFLDAPELPESAHTVLAGAGSGALFRSPRGPRQALAAGVVGMVGGAAVAGLRTLFPSF